MATVADGNLLEAVLPKLDPMIGEGLVTNEKAEIRLYRERGHGREA